MSDIRISNSAPGTGSEAPHEAPSTQPPAIVPTEAIDLDPDLARAVDQLYRDHDSADHYALLGLGRSVDRKAVKRAYYELAAKIHPDKHFRKKLGSYKLKMEVVFARLTLAHDTLSDREKRAEYDAYLEERQRARSIEEILADAFTEAQRAETTIEHEARASSTLPPAAARAAAPPSPDASSGPERASRAPAPGAVRNSLTPVVDVSARRDALARRLLGGARAGMSSAPPGGVAHAVRAASVPPPGASTLAGGPGSGPNGGSPLRSAAGTTSAEAMGSLRRRYEDRIFHAKTVQARKYTDRAAEAAVAGDLVAVASALRVASSLVPGDPELKRRAADAQLKADALLAETYTHQAEYEEKNGNHPAAARSWARVCKVRPNDARAHERAANAIVKAGGDLHEAARLGTRAREVEPTNPAARVTLASVYAAAGLVLNARRELEAAAQLAPDDENIRELIKKSAKAT